MGRPPDCNCNCGTVEPPEDCAFTDDFADAETGYTTYTWSGATTAVFSLSGGKVLLDGTTSSGSYYRTVAVNPSGLKTLSVQAKVYKPSGTTGGTGIFIGGVRAMFRRGNGDDTTIWTASSVGEISGFTNPGVATASGDTLKIQLQETSTGIYQITFYKNGSQILVQSNVALTLGSVFNVGIVGTLSDCSWDDLVVACDENTECQAEAMAVVYRVSSAGAVAWFPFSSFSCSLSGCAKWNTPIFVYYSSGCWWYSSDRLSCLSRLRAYWAMKVNLVSPGVYSASLYAGYAVDAGFISFLAQYTGIFSPLAQSTLTQQGSTGGCTNWPTTITIEPA